MAARLRVAADDAARAGCERRRAGEGRRVDRVRGAVPGGRHGGARAAAAAHRRRGARARERRALPARRAHRRVSAARQVLRRVRDPRGARGRRAARDAAQHRRARARRRARRSRAGSSASAPIPRRSRAGCGACARRARGAASAANDPKTGGASMLARGRPARRSVFGASRSDHAARDPQARRRAARRSRRHSARRAGLLRGRAREPPARRVAARPRRHALCRHLRARHGSRRALQVGPRELARVGDAPRTTAQPVAGAQRRWSTTTAPGGELWRGDDRRGRHRRDRRVVRRAARLRTLRRMVAPSADRDRASPRPPAHDFSFALSSWDKGIDPCVVRVRDRVGSECSGHRLTPCSTARSSARARPSSMKHFLRRHVSQGIAVPEQAARRAQGRDLTRAAAISATSSRSRSAPTASPSRAGRFPPKRSSATTGSRSTDAPSARFKVEEFRLPTMRASVSGSARAAGAAARGDARSARRLRRRRRRERPAGEAAHGGGAVAPAASGLRGLRVRRRAGDARGSRSRRAATGTSTSRPGRREQTAKAQRRAGHARRGGRGARHGPRSARGRQARHAHRRARVRGSRTASCSPRRAACASCRPSSPSASGARAGSASSEQMRFRVVVLDLDGKPVARQRVAATLYHAQRYSYRKRLLGGFYTYESAQENTKLDASCAGRDERAGPARVRGGAGRLGRGDRARGGARRERPGRGRDRVDLGRGRGRLVVRRHRGRSHGSPARAAGVRGGPGRALPGAHAVPLRHRARHGRARGRAAQLRHRAVRAGAGGEGADRARRRAERVRLGARGARPPRGEALVVRFLERAARGDRARRSRRSPPIGSASRRSASAGSRIASPCASTPDRETYAIRETAKVDIAVAPEDESALPPGAEVAVAAVDEALLELAPNRSWDLLEAMMGRRGIEVWTSTAQLQVVGKRHYGRKAVPHGGGGGRERARESFDTLLLWQGRVKLDRDGARAGRDSAQRFADLVPDRRRRARRRRALRHRAARASRRARI